MTSKEKAESIMEKYQRERLEYWKRRNPSPPPAVPAEGKDESPVAEETKCPKPKR